MCVVINKLLLKSHKKFVDSHFPFFSRFQNLHDATLAKYKVKVLVDHTGLVLPVFSPTGALMRVRILSVVKDEDKDCFKVETKTQPR